MTDRELLENAAKAAGYTLKWGEVYIVGDDEVDCTDIPYVVSGQPDEADWHWSPIDDDGDALRLAVALGLCVEVLRKRMEPFTRVGHIEEEHRDNAAHATRRAIARAAAEIGKDMK